MSFSRINTCCFELLWFRLLQLLKALYHLNSSGYRRHTCFNVRKLCTLVTHCGCMLRAMWNVVKDCSQCCMGRMGFLMEETRHILGGRNYTQKVGASKASVPIFGWKKRLVVYTVSRPTLGLDRPLIYVMCYVESSV
jgi:hypothetical protein